VVLCVRSLARADLRGAKAMVGLSPVVEGDETASMCASATKPLGGGTVASISSRASDYNADVDGDDRPRAGAVADSDGEDANPMVAPAAGDGLPRRVLDWDDDRPVKSKVLITEVVAEVQEEHSLHWSRSASVPLAEVESVDSGKHSHDASVEDNVVSVRHDEHCAAVSPACIALLLPRSATAHDVCVDHIHGVSSSLHHWSRSHTCVRGGGGSCCAAAPCHRHHEEPERGAALAGVAAAVEPRSQGQRDAPSQRS
jgi:hypothetical protein